MFATNLIGRFASSFNNSWCEIVYVIVEREGIKMGIVDNGTGQISEIGGYGIRVKTYDQLIASGEIVPVQPVIPPVG